jgi:hypothetical protein
MRAVKTTLVIMLVIAGVILMARAASADEFKLNLSGATYTKWLWGNMRGDGSMYNFTTVPGEGYGDNGQGSELELFVDAKVSKKVSVHARIHSRFSQNEWTNYGGWGGSNPIASGTSCIGGDCGEFDPRSNQYIKLRGVAVTFTPGYKWLDDAVIGASDWGMFDPFVVGRIRYIDRDNASGLLFQGSMGHREFTWDFARISLPRLWAGPLYNTGIYNAADASYAIQFKYTASSMFDVGGIFNYVNDQEIDAADNNFDNGLNLKTRFRNSVAGVKFGIHPDAVWDFRGVYYHSTVASVPLGLPGSCMGNNCEVPTSFGMNGYSPVITGNHQGSSWKANVDVNDPFGVGLSFNAEAFFLGANYASMMAARRESDVLLTEGHDSAFALPGPSNATYGVFGGNRTRIGYGGWDGNAVQVATINVDNEFTDFPEPMAETAIGWKGITLVPTYTSGSLQLSGEYTHLGYDTNWQAWGNPNRSITDTDYPAMDVETGVGSFRSAYAPFQDKKTDIAVFKGKYVLNVGKGVDIFWKAKLINETDNRMNEARFLPYAAGDCSYTGPCNNVANYYSPGLSTSSYYSNPPWITVTNPVTHAVQSGYQWKPWDSLSDDDRKLDYYTLQLGAGYQLTNDLYASIEYHYDHANLKDGDTAFQAYNLMEMASGISDKNYVIVKAKLPVGGADIGFEYQYVFGTFKPDFGTGYVVQYADTGTAANVGVPVNSPGFAGRYGGWNSLLERHFDQQRILAYMKILF